MKILDLNSKSNYVLNVQKNISLLAKKFKNGFILKDNDIEIPCIIYKYYEPDNKNLYYYIMQYNKKDIDTFLLPLKIYFIDYYYLKKNNNCYIANIHKTENYTGSTIITTVLKFLKQINIKKVSLHDAASILCEPVNRSIDLSFIKLIEKGETFYQKFGFKFVLGTEYSKMKFGSSKNLNKKLFNYLKKFKKVKNNDLIIIYKSILDIFFKIIDKQDYNNTKIYLLDSNIVYNKKTNYIRRFIIETVKEIDSILNILKKSQEIYFYKTLLRLFYDECYNYIILKDYIIDNNFYGIKYEKKKILLDFQQIFQKIQLIKNISTFQLDMSNIKKIS